MEKRLVEETKQLDLDLNNERQRYQNLLQEFSRLEERYDDLKDEMKLMVVSSLKDLEKFVLREPKALPSKCFVAHVSGSPGLLLIGCKTAGGGAQSEEVAGRRLLNTCTPVPLSSFSGE